MSRPMRGGNPSDGGMNAAKAVVIIVVAVVIGVVVLAKVHTRSSPTTAGETSRPTTSTAPTSTVPAAVTTTTAVPPSQIKVQVLNGLLVGPLASEWNAKLKAKGYMVGLADNATTKTTQSAIYVLTPGYQAEANALATAVGLPTTYVQPYPPPASAPIPASERTGTNLVLIIGNELAGTA